MNDPKFLQTLSGSSLSIYLALVLAGGSVSTQAEAADLAGCSLRSASSALNRLRELGLVEQLEHRWVLSDGGRVLLRSIISVGAGILLAAPAGDEHTRSASPVGAADLLSIMAGGQPVDNSADPVENCGEIEESGMQNLHTNVQNLHTNVQNLHIADRSDDAPTSPARARAHMYDVCDLDLRGITTDPEREEDIHHHSSELASRLRLIGFWDADRFVRANSHILIREWLDFIGSGSVKIKTPGAFLRRAVAARQRPPVVSDSAVCLDCGSSIFLGDGSCAVCAGIVEI